MACEMGIDLAVRDAVGAVGAVEIIYMLDRDHEIDTIDS